MNKSKPGPTILAKNRRARFEYHVLETFEAGIALLGTEVKSARAGKVQLRDSFVEFRDGEAYLVHAHISPYSHGNQENHDPERPRKLLLHRRELDRLYGRAILRGLSVVPLSMYIKGNRVKLEIALVQGKKLHDKREAQKRRELEREVAETLGRRG